MSHGQHVDDAHEWSHGVCGEQLLFSPETTLSSGDKWNEWSHKSKHKNRVLKGGSAHWRFCFCSGPPAGSGWWSVLRAEWEFRERRSGSADAGARVWCQWAEERNEGSRLHFSWLRCGSSQIRMWFYYFQNHKPEPDFIWVWNNTTKTLFTTSTWDHSDALESFSDVFTQRQANTSHSLPVFKLS